MMAAITGYAAPTPASCLRVHTLMSYACAAASC